jgi:hypothetical protein
MPIIDLPSKGRYPMSNSMRLKMVSSSNANAEVPDPEAPAAGGRR